MAEFALGWTKTVVEGTVSLVKSAVEEEKMLREKVQNDLVFITGEFEVMRSFLQDASREHARNDKVALTLERQLRTLAFDVEDCVEYVVHLDLGESSSWGWLRRLWQTVNCHTPPLPLDVAVAEIKQLKARVEDLSQRNTRYNNLILHSSNNQPVRLAGSASQHSTSVSRLLSLATYQPASHQYFYLTTNQPASQPNGANNSRQQPAVTAVMSPAEQPPWLAPAFHILRHAWEATGKWSSNKCNLQQELLMACEGEGDHDLRVISVWGSTGGGGGGAAADLGTASIFGKAYCDPEICEKFRSRAWVKLTYPFNYDEFVKSLLTQFYATSHQANAEFTEVNLIRAKKAMMQQMTRQRYLVVLEDVVTVAEWDVIRMYLPNNKNGSRILLSTPQLGIALLCTGEPYQVSELRNFSGDNQFRCAFSKKEKVNTIEFVRQLLRGHGVISVWGADDDDDKSNLVDILYKGIINGWLEEIGEVVADKSDHVDMLYEGIRNRRRKFEWRQSSWVDVPDPLDLKVFAQRLFLNFHSDDIRAKEITEVGMKGEAGLIEWCRMFLSEEKDHHYVVVINGLQSKDDWDKIQSTFFSPKTATGQGCILVITNEETLATHCVKDRTHLVFSAKDLKADPSISALINKGCWHYAIRGKKGRLFYDRKKDAREWANKFEHVGGNILDPNEGKDEEERLNVFMVKRDKKDFFTVKPPWTSTKGVSGVIEGGNSEKAVLRHAYYGALFQQQVERRCSWVDFPCRVDMPWFFVPLDSTDFAWRLLLDFYSDDPQAKEQVAVGLMEGTIDPIEKCREFLRNNKCLVVINGLQFYRGLQFQKDYWFSVIDTFFSEQHIQSIIIFGFSSERCIYGTTKVLWLDTQQEGRLIDMEYRYIFSTRKRYQEAIGWFETHRLVGRDTEVEDIRIKVLTENLVAVWGPWEIRGIGKSTVVRTVYYKEIIYSSGLESSYGLGPTESFAWVDVPSPFNLTDFAWRLLLSLYSDDPHAEESAAVSMVEQGHQVPIPECRKILRTRNCLVVMDGLCSKLDWDLIQATFLAGPIKGTIVVITNEEVAMHCVGNDKRRTVNITRLNANAALSLFEKIAWEGKKLTPGEMEISKSIVAKCGGLPKVIADIGEAFVSMRWQRFSNTNSWLESLSHNFMGRLEMDPEFHELRPLLSWMQSYFDAFSDSIKPCIFYLSIFDAEKNIRLRRLMWRWIAEGYCRDTSDGTTCEENGKKFISELVKLSIIQESANSKVFCQINNAFFLEYIISRSMEDNLVFALEGHCSLNSQRAGQHLTIRSSWDRNKFVYESIDFSRLRSLTVFGKWESFFICSKKVNMRLLRVLDLEDATDVSNEDLDKIAKLLTRLKFLSLRGHTKINCLPISIGGLRQLQTLDIRGTSIVTLPLFITKLQKLRYIRAGTTEVWDWEGDIVEADGEENRESLSSAEEGDIVQADGEEDSAVSADGEMEVKTSSSAPADTNLQAGGATPIESGTDNTGLVLQAELGSSVSCNNRPGNLVSSLLSKLCSRGVPEHDNDGPAAGVTVPRDIGKLVVLHTLGVVKVNAQCRNKAIFQELKKLTQLCKLSVSGINKGNIHEFCEAISGHAYLKSLSVELDKDDDLDDNIPEPPKTIQSLKLYGRVHKLFLVWVKHLHNLEKLHLTIEKPEESRYLAELSMSGMGHLRMRSIQDGELHIVEVWRLPKIVEIQCSSVLHIKFGDEDQRVFIAPNTVVLKVHFSGGSQLKISGLSELTKLKEVWLKGYTDAHKQYMQQQIDEIESCKKNFDEIELDVGKKKPVLKLVRPRSS